MHEVSCEGRGRTIVQFPRVQWCVPADAAVMKREAEWCHSSSWFNQEQLECLLLVTSNEDEVQLSSATH